MENLKEEGSNRENEPEVQEGSSRWIGLLAIVLFFIFDGWSICPWYMWIVFALLALLTLSGLYKWGQAFFGIILLIWGSSLFGGSENRETDSYYEATTSGKSEVKQSASERRMIEREIEEIESLYAQYLNADRRGADAEARRLSEIAFNKYQKIQGKNLTSEQRARLSKLFAL